LSRWLLRQLQGTRGVLLVLIGYFLLQWLLRITAGGGLELDEAEQLLFAQRLQIGYSPDPPLYTWLQILFFKVLGAGIPALSLLKNLLLFGIYLSLYFIGRNCGLNSQLSGLATLSLLLFPQVGWELQRDLTHSVLVTTLAGLTLWSALALLNGRRGLQQYLLLALLLSLGILSKWNYLLFALLLLLTLVSLQPRLLWRPQALPLLLLPPLITAPFLVWVSSHLATATASSHKLTGAGSGYWTGVVQGVLSLLTAYAAFAGLFLLLFALIFKAWQQRAGWFDGSRPDALRLLQRICCGAALLLLLYVLISGNAVIRDRYLLPALFFLPALLFARAPAILWQADALRRYARVLLLAALLIPLGLAARVWLKPYTGDYTKPHFPGQQLAAALLQQAGESPVLLAQNGFIGGNLQRWLGGAFVSAPPMVFPLDRLLADEQRLLLVWNGGKSRRVPQQLQQYWQQRLTGEWGLVSQPAFIERRYRFSDDQGFTLGWQWLQRSR